MVSVVKHVVLFCLFCFPISGNTQFAVERLHYVQIDDLAPIKKRTDLDYPDLAGAKRGSISPDRYSDYRRWQFGCQPRRTHARTAVYVYSSV